MPTGHYPRTPKPRDLQQEVADRTVRDSETGCLLWQPKPGQGRPRKNPLRTINPVYPTLWINRRLVRVSWLVLEWDGRPLRAGELALHTCDRPECVEKTHLFAGTQQQNVFDAVRKGRWNPGRKGNGLNARYSAESV